LPARLDGPDRAESRGAAPRRRAAAQRLAAPLDRGRLRLPDRGIAGHNGTLGDRIGRRRLLLAGAAAFGAASAAAAFATSAETLIAARAVLGLAGATLAPSTLSLLRAMFRDERERAFAVGVWVASFSAGAALGPLVGGALLAYFWWGSVFLAASL
jgi:MFS family permease